jgi:hypothetical protein
MRVLPQAFAEVDHAVISVLTAFSAVFHWLIARARALVALL